MRVQCMCVYMRFVFVCLRLGGFDGEMKGTCMTDRLKIIGKWVIHERLIY